VNFEFGSTHQVGNIVWLKFPLHMAVGSVGNIIQQSGEPDIRPMFDPDTCETQSSLSDRRVANIDLTIVCINRLKPSGNFTYHQV
jgi:hypothetical protein